MSPKTQKRSPSSPNSQRKTKKNVRFSEEVPQEFVFERDFSPEDITLLWSSKVDRKKARKDKANENNVNSESIHTRFGKIEKSDSEFNPEEVIQLSRQIPVKSIHIKDLQNPVPKKKKNFIFRILSKAKSLVFNKKGGMNKTKKYKGEHKSRQ